jgi:hypothetical protein
MTKPAKTWRDRGIDIAAWESKGGFSFTFRKTYKDKTSGEYKESRYYYLEDLDRLALLLSEALSWAGEATDDRRSTSVTIAEKGKLPDAIDSDEIPF